MSDDGHRLGWKLGGRNQVLPDNFVQTDGHEVIVFLMPFDYMHVSPTSFSDFDQQRRTPSAYEAILQLIIHAAHRIDLKCTTSNDNSQRQKDEHPVNIYFETVMYDADYERPEDASVRERRFVREHLRRLLRDAELFEGSTARLESARVRAMRFMRDLDDREVFGVRIFVFSREPSVTVSTYMASILMENFSRSQKAAENPGLKFEDRSHQQRVKMSGGADDLPALTDKTEVFRRIPNMHEWATVVGMYTQNARLAEDTFYRSQMLQTREPFESARNVLHPSGVFDLVKHFERVALDQRIDARQRDIAFYVRDNRRRTFPYPSAVLMLDPAHMSITNLRRLYVPSYQKRMVEPARDTSLAATLALLKAHNAAQRELAEDEGREVDDDLLVNAVDNIEIAGHESDDEPGGVFFESPEEAERANVDGEAAAAADDGDGAEEGEEEVAFDPEKLLASIEWRDPAQRRLERQYTATQTGSGAPKQETHRMRDRFYGEMRPAISAIPERKDRARMRAKMQMSAIAEYESKCMSPSSDVSKAARQINLWASLVSQPGAPGLRFLRDYRFRDAGSSKPGAERPPLSFFGNTMVGLFDDFENVLCTYTAHSVIWLTFITGWNSFRYVLGLRGHLLLYGPPQSSKSFPLDQYQNISIPGTFLETTSTSERSGDVDENHNDLTMLFHEMELGSISGGSGSSAKAGGGHNNKSGGAQAGSGACDQMKNVMTSGIQSRLVCDISGADGKRTTRRVISEKQQAYIMCTNALADDLDPAFLSRAVAVLQVERARADGVTVGDKQADMAERRDDADSELYRLRHDLRLVQCITYHVEKLIKIGILVEPTLVAFQHIYSTYKATLETQFGIRLKRRQHKKVKIYVREHVVINAVLWLYTAPTSPCFGKEFSIYHMPLLEPMLKDTSEIVFFVMDLLRDMFIDPVKRAVRMALRERVLPELFEKQRAAARSEYQVAESARNRVLPLAMFRPTLGHERDRGFDIFQRALGQKTLRSVPGVVGADQRAAIQRMPGAGAAAAAAAAGGNAEKGSQDAAVLAMRSDKYDTNYVHFGATLNEVAHMVAKETDCLPELSEPLSVAAVRQELEAMLGQRVFAPRYQMQPNGERYPPVRPVANGARRAAVAAAKKIGPKYEFAIHSELVFGEVGDPHEQAIRSCVSAYSRTARYVAGRPPQEDLPFVLNVRNIEPSNGTHEARKRTSSGTDKIPMIGTSLDKMSTGKRLQKLGIRDTAANRRRFDPEVDALVMVHEHKHVVDNPIHYPLDPLVEAQKRLEAKKRARDFNARANQADVQARVRTGEIELAGMPADEDDDDEAEDDPYRKYDQLLEQRATEAEVNQKPSFAVDKPITDYLEPERDLRGRPVDVFGPLLRAFGSKKDADDADDDDDEDGDHNDKQKASELEFALPPAKSAAVATKAAADAPLKKACVDATSSGDDEDDDDALLESDELLLDTPAVLVDPFEGRVC